MSQPNFGRNPLARLIPIAVGVVILLVVVANCYMSVPAGHVAVATLFGEVQDKPYKEGLHFPVNPLLEFHRYDARQKSHFETAQVPSQDQLQTKIDVSVQYRIRASQVSSILKETGTVGQMVEVHLVPKLRSSLREQGKTIKRAEDFFLEETQEQLQVALLADLGAYLAPKGIEVDAVLIRDIVLPAFIKKAIESKKEREQAVERERAELDRFRLAQQQEVAKAEAQRAAADEEAAQRRVLADAQAYEIRELRKAIGDDPAYIKLQALEALKAMAKDPAAKIYFINSDSPMPLPLMHMGER